MLCAKAAASTPLEPSTVTLPVTTTWPAFTAQNPVTATLEYVPAASDPGAANVPEQVVAAAAAIVAPPSAPNGTTNRADTDATPSRATLRPPNRRVPSER